VDLPENPEGSALILMLPGAGGTSESFRQDTLFHEYACPKGYAMADEQFFIRLSINSYSSSISLH